MNGPMYDIWPCYYSLRMGAPMWVWARGLRDAPRTHTREVSVGVDWWRKLPVGRRDE